MTTDNSTGDGRFILFSFELEIFGAPRDLIASKQDGSSAKTCIWAISMRQQSHRRPPCITSSAGRERAEIGRISRQVATDRLRPVLSESVAPTAYPATHARAYSQRNATEELDFVGSDVQWRRIRPMGGSPWSSLSHLGGQFFSPLGRAHQTRILLLLARRHLRTAKRPSV